MVALLMSHINWRHYLIFFSLLYSTVPATCAIVRQNTCNKLDWDCSLINDDDDDMEL